MKIIDLKDKHKKLYFVCLEDWSDEMKDAGDHKECWYNKMKDKGLRVKIALDDKDNVGGMIQYIPIEYSFADGEDLYFITCIWVHGYKEGRGNFQKKGMGRALLNAAEEDVRVMGAKGIAAWGIPFPFWMKAAWFIRQGYTRADKLGLFDAVLLWKPFTEDAVAPRWIKPMKEPEKTPGKVTITGLINGWCPAQNIAFERARKVAADFGDRVIFREINTFKREILLEWGISDGLFIDNRRIRTGPPPSLEKLHAKIARQVRKL